MDTIKFIIQRSNTMCRITARDIRTDIRNLSDGGCISDMEILLDEMENIKQKAKEMGFNVVFEIEDFRD